MKAPKAASAISLMLLSSLAFAQSPTPDNSAPGAVSESPSAKSQDDAQTPEKSTPVPAATSKDKDKKHEIVTVTGSRIRRDDMTAASPLTVLSRQDIQNTGAQTVTDVVKQLPSAIGNSVTTSTTNGGGNGSGNIALRGLDSSSTLVLLNGKRLPLDAGGQSPDMNSIPVAAIERIEVLQDGASAIYGSDAIAGVINIITRKDFEGLDFSVLYGQASRGDARTQSVDVTYGVGNDKGHMLLGINNYSQGRVRSRDRDVSRQTLAPSSATPNGHVVTDTQNVTTPKGSTNPTPAAGDFVDYDGAADGYNYSQVTDAIMAQQRKSVFMSGDYEFNSWLKGFTEVMVTQTDSHFDSAPTPLFTSQETGGIHVSAANPYNPFGADLTDVRKRFTELGPRSTDTTSNTDRIVAGVEGTFAKDWTWDLSWNKGHTDVRSFTPNIINKTNLILGLGDPANCADLTSLGCTSVNVTGPEGSLTQAQIDWIRTSAVNTTRTDMTSYLFNTSGTVAETGLGKIGLAVGAEIRNERYNDIPDAQSQAFNTVGNVNSRATEGSRDAHEIYGEVSVPFTKIVELDLAARYSDYSDFGKSTNPKVGLKITPIDGLLIRGTYATGFRAPSLPELYGGQVENFAQVLDPCQNPGACTVQADPNINQFLALQGGNTHLDPEKSKSFTGGIAYNLNGFNAKVDYFRIRTEHAIDTSPQFIVDQFRKNGSFADKVHVDANNNITLIEATALNLAAREVRGVDIGTDYTTGKTSSGIWSVGVNATNYIEYKNQADASSPFVNMVGKFVDAAEDGRGSIPKWKGLATFDWTGLSGVSAGVTANAVSALETESPDYPKLGAWTTWDLRAGYTFQNYGNIGIGCDNFTDRKPPVTDAAFNDNIDARTHNLLGRFYYARYGITL